MPQPSITFNLGQGGLGQPAQGQDYISGMQFYGTAPGTFVANIPQAVFSLPDAVTKGITNDYADETAATGTYLITTKGNTGDTIVAIITEALPNGKTQTVNLGLYTVGSSDTTIALQGAAWAAIINAGTYSHGYSASFTTATLTITARKGLGINLNSGTPLGITLTGAFAGTITQFSGGVYSKKILWYYQIAEIYRNYPQAKVWVMFTASPSILFTELQTLQAAANNGECRRIGVYSFTARTAANVITDLGAMNTIGTTLFNNYMPCEFIYSPNIQTVSDLSTLINLQNTTYPYASVCIGQDGANVGTTATPGGAQLYVNSGVSVGAVGAAVATKAKGAISQNIGEVGAFNLSNGLELAVPAFTNGQLASALTANLLNQLDGYRYIFLTTYTNFTGTYFNSDYTAAPQTSDYNSLARNEVIQKAVRGLYAGILPLLKSRINLNSDGTLTEVSMQQFKTNASPTLIQMATAGDLSSGMVLNGKLAKGVITIDPTQNVLSTNKIVIAIKLLPVGYANFITVNIGFVPTL